MLNDNEKERYSKFCHFNISKKMNKILSFYKHSNQNLSDNDAKGLILAKNVIKSLVSIRNCFADHNGYVRERDGEEVGNTNERIFKWITLKCSESVFPIVQQSQEKRFKVHELLTFSSQETTDIALSLKNIRILLEAFIMKKRNNDN